MIWSDLVGNGKRSRYPVRSQHNDGRGAGAIAREVQKEGLDCTIETARGWIDAYFQTYPKIKDYLDYCRKSVKKPGFLRNPYGRTRKFITSMAADNTVAGMEREASNFNIQSTVGDSMSIALMNLDNYRTRIKQQPDMFKILLSIHDAVLLSVPIPHVRQVVEEALPMCMTDGLEVPGIGLKYTLGDPDISFRWDEKTPREELIAAGVPEDLV